jgi:hypothetical protein
MHMRFGRLALGFVLALLLGSVFPVYAVTSLQYVLPGTSVQFSDTGGQVVMAFSNKATLTGQVSALADKGVTPTAAQPAVWQAQCSISLTGTNIVAATVEYYIATSQDGTTLDGGVTANAALASADKRRNLTPIGVLVVDQTTTNTTMIATFRNIYIPSRYYALAFYNNTTLPTETSTTKHKCVFTPMPVQMQ